MDVRTKVRGVRELLYAALAPNDAYVYLGSATSSNAGDRALFLAHQHLLGNCQLLPVETLWAAKRLGRLPAHLRRHPRPLLGGGTLIGDQRWRSLAEQFGNLASLSVGVRTPEEPGAEAAARWRGLFDPDMPVGVRGPRSAEVLADAGIEAEVVGDPVLGLPPLSKTRDSSGTVGINVGVTTWMFGDQQRLVDEVLAATRRLSRQRRIRIFSVWPPDDGPCERLHAEVDASELVRWNGNLTSFLQAISDCDIFIGEKLHACCFAALAAVPTIALAYRDKCLDFHDSINRHAWSIRTDAVSAAEIIDHVEAIDADRIEQTRDLQNRVATLRQRLVTRASLLSGQMESYEDAARTYTSIMRRATRRGS